MSESSPGAAQPEPTSGTPAGTVEAVPAASSAVETPVVETPVVETPAVETAEVEAPKPSLLSETKEEPAKEAAKEAPKAEEAKPEVKEEPKEPKAEEPKADEKKDEPKAEEAKEPVAVKPPVFETYTLPEGVSVEPARMEAFNGILGETETRIAADPAQAHVAMQELGQKLADFHVAEMRTAAERAARHNREHWDHTREGWVSEFRNDPELGKNRAESTLTRIGSLIDMYGTHAGSDKVTQLRDTFTLTGAGDHPEVLRFLDWAANRLVETRRIVVPQPTVKAPARTPAQTLYAKTPVTRSA